MAMTVIDRDELEQLLALLEAAASPDANVQAAMDKLKRALGEANACDLLTTAEAAQALGVRSVNTVKYWVKTNYLQGVKRGNRTLIPLSEIERIKSQDRVWMIQTSEQRQDATRLPGDDRPLMSDELAILQEARSGINPWK